MGVPPDPRDRAEQRRLAENAVQRIRSWTYAPIPQAFDVITTRSSDTDAAAGNPGSVPSAMLRKSGPQGLKNLSHRKKAMSIFWHNTGGRADRVKVSSIHCILADLLHSPRDALFKPILRSRRFLE